MILTALDDVLTVGHVCAVVPILFQYSLKDTEEDRVTSLDHIFTVEPMKLTGPSTDTEVALALRVLEGCCLIYRQSTILAHQHKAIPVPHTIYFCMLFLGSYFILHFRITFYLHPTTLERSGGILCGKGGKEECGCFPS